VGDLCNSVPKLPEQLGGGLDDYPFCLLPATTLDVSNAARVSRVTDAGPIKEKATIRVGWSSEGLHFQVHVDDEDVLPAAADAGDELWKGDCVEIYAKGDNVTTGPFDGVHTDLGAVQVLVTAPTGDTVRGLYYFNGSTSKTLPLDPKDYSGRVVPGGYEIYLLLRWDVLRPVVQDASAPVPPASGQRIALDFVLDVKDSAGSSLDAQLMYATTPVLGAPLPSCQLPTPYCDDRTWCASTLE
jgi:hypothetical protein